MFKKIAVCALFLFIGLAIGIGYRHASGNASTSPQGSGKNSDCPHDLLNPSFCYENSDAILVNQATLDRAIRNYIASKRADGTISKTGVYYRDLRNGPTLNIGAEETYYGGSLLKVPIMILYLKYAEQDKGLLKKRVLIGNNVQLTQLKDKSQAAERGKTYTVLELIEKMIIHSDNSSKGALNVNMQSLLGTGASTRTVMNELGIQDEADKSGIITLKEYASIFRSLYNSQYLSSEMSQLALRILAQSSFDRGISAGVPKDVTVANKFGIPEATSSAKLQLHDCGIVYHTRSPYQLCIFTEGNDYLSMEKVIIEISEAIYVLVDKAKE